TPPPCTAAQPPPPTCEPPPRTACPPQAGAPCMIPPSPSPPPPGVGLEKPRGEGDIVWGPMGGPRPTPAPAAAPGGTPGVEDLQRRCADLEAKIDVLVDALNRSRANGQR